MHLKPLYRVRFTYLYKASVTLPGPDGTEDRYVFLPEGRSEGRITGRFRGANHPRHRTDRTVVPDFEGVSETDDGTLIMFDYFGYRHAYQPEARQIISAATHLSDDERYQWLNDVMCVGTGELCPGELILDVAELVWEPFVE